MDLVPAEKQNPTAQLSAYTRLLIFKSRQVSTIENKGKSLEQQCRVLPYSVSYFHNCTNQHNICGTNSLTWFILQKLTHILLWEKNAFQLYHDLIVRLSFDEANSSTNSLKPILTFALLRFKCTTFLWCLCRLGCFYLGRWGFWCCWSYWLH